MKLSDNMTVEIVDGNLRLDWHGTFVILSQAEYSALITFVRNAGAGLKKAGSATLAGNAAPPTPMGDSYGVSVAAERKRAEDAERQLEATNVAVDCASENEKDLRTLAGNLKDALEYVQSVLGSGPCDINRCDSCEAERKLARTALAKALAEAQAAGL